MVRRLFLCISSLRYHAILISMVIVISGAANVASTCPESKLVINTAVIKDAGYDNPFLAPTAWAAGYRDSRSSKYAPVNGPSQVEPAWNALTDTSIFAPPTIGLDGTIYVTAIDAQGCSLHALDPYTGKSCWCSKELGIGAIAHAPTVDSDGNLYLGDRKHIASFTPQGDLRWKVPIDEIAIGSNLTSEGHIVAISITGHVYIYDRRDGHLRIPKAFSLPVAVETIMLQDKWLESAKKYSSMYLPANLTFELEDAAIMMGIATAQTPVANSPAVDPKTGTIYITAKNININEGFLYALRYQDGDPGEISVFWQYSFEGGSGTSPAVGNDGTVYFADGVRFGIALNPNGALKWKTALKTRSDGSPTVDPDGRVVFLANFSPALFVRDEGNSYLTSGTSSPYITDSLVTETLNKRYYFIALKQPDFPLIIWDIEKKKALQKVPIGTSSEALVIVSHDGWLYTTHVGFISGMNPATKENPRGIRAFRPISF